MVTGEANVWLEPLQSDQAKMDNVDLSRAGLAKIESIEATSRLEIGATRRLKLEIVVAHQVPGELALRTTTTHLPSIGNVDGKTANADQLKEKKIQFKLRFGQASLRPCPSNSNRHQPEPSSSCPLQQCA